MIRLFLKSAATAAGVVIGLAAGIVAVGTAVDAIDAWDHRRRETEPLGREEVRDVLKGIAARRSAPTSPLTGAPLDGEARRG